MADTNHQTVIAAGTQIKGEMSFDQAVRIEGHFEGKINAKGDLQIAEGAVCRAEVHAGNIIVDGTVEGNLRANERVQVSSKAKLVGDVVAAKMTTAEGASIQGRVTIGPDASRTAASSAVASQSHAAVSQAH